MRMKETTTKAGSQSLTARNGDILFVFGAARSGTTYLNGLLDKWFDYGMGPEGTFVAKFAARLYRYGDLNDEANLKRLVEDISRCNMLEIVRNKYPEGNRFDITPEMILERLPDRSYAGVVYSVFACMAAVQGRTHVGNKDPGYWQMLPLLHRLFPDNAKYLCIVRDGRDVAISTMRTPWGQKSAYVCARTWAASLRAVEVFASEVSEDKLLIIRYEDLLDDPAVTLGKLQVFLGINLGVRGTALLKQAENNPMRTNYGKWRNNMNPDEIRVFEAVAGAELVAYGYERRYDSPAASPLERFRYNTAELLRLVRVNLFAAPE